MKELTEDEKQILIECLFTFSDDENAENILEKLNIEWR
jgi:hypothetical protein